MSLFKDLKGTSLISFVLNLTGVRLKDSAGNLLVRNNADSADAEVTASKVNVSGDSIVLNSDAAASGADYKITMARPASGMTANYTMTLPPAPGTQGQVIGYTDNAGTLGPVSAGSTADCTHVDVTTINYGDSSPISMFTLPANAQYLRTQVVIDTPFNGTSPTLSVGVAGTISKFMPATAVNIAGTVGDIYEYDSSTAIDASSEAVIATLSSGSSTAGSVRILCYYTIPG